MSEIIKYKCDICGDISEIHTLWLTVERGFGRGHRRHLEKDICEKCLFSLEKWIEEKSI